MPRVYVYEHFTATIPNPYPADSLYREGRAMRDAVVEDLRAIPGVEVLSPSPVGGEGSGVGGDIGTDRFDARVRTCDFALVIAPETDGILEALVRRVEAAGVRLLGPSADAIRLTSDKLALSRHWRAADVPTPATWKLDDADGCPFPRVLKPRDGCGSGGIRVCADESSFAATARAISGGARWIVQPHCPGTAVSVSSLAGPRTTIALPPATQSVSPDTNFRYDGGELPIPPALAARARSLADLAARCVPGLTGFFGVDLVLGADPDGTEDVAVEINPRPTTSYVGLRASAATNLMAALLAVVSGREPDPIRWRPGRVRFRPNGGVENAGG